jgi:hypothetical protein
VGGTPEEGEGRYEMMVERKAASDFPYAEMKISGWNASFLRRVAKEIKRILLFDICMSPDQHLS